MNKDWKLSKSFVNDEAMINSLVIYGAFDEARLVGVMAVKDEGKHISLFFIREEYHRKGIGRKIIRCFYRRDFCAGNDCKFLYVCSAFLQKSGI
ncbi:MAG: GNAT family N-acetyltransferase [Bacteroides cellulosilyticus]